MLLFKKPYAHLCVGLEVNVKFLEGEQVVYDGYLWINGEVFTFFILKYIYLLAVLDLGR